MEYQIAEDFCPEANNNDIDLHDFGLALMAIENYSLDDIKVILQAFNLPAQPFATRKDLTADIYFRQVAALDGIDLLQDTLDYVRSTFMSGRQLANHRKVAFLFENSNGKFAVIACYQNLLSEKTDRLIAQTHWQQTAPSLSEMCRSTFTSQFSTIYESIRLEYVVPFGTQDDLPSSFRHLPFPRRAHILSENSGVTLTESILMLLFGDDIFPMELEQIFNNQRRRCEQQLIGWLNDFQKTNPAEYQEIIDLLAIVIKFTLLDSQQTTLLNMPDRQDFLRHNERLKKYFFRLSLGDIADILPHLPLTGIIHVLRLCHEPSELIKQLGLQRRTQEQTISDREKQVMHLAQPLNWRAWAAQSLGRVPEYCYARSHVNLGAHIVPWVMQQITPTCIEKSLETILQRILLLVTQVFNFVPQNVRHLGMRQLMHKNTLTAFNACVGGGLGLLSMYYSGIFEALFSLMLLFLTEFFYDFLTTKRIDLNSASVIPRISSVPSMATLLRLNMLLILVLIGLYTNNSDYLKRAGTMMGVSELVRQLFSKYSRDIELTAEEHSYCEFILAQCGLQFGELIFSTYSNVQTAIVARDNVIEKLSREAQSFDGYTEAPSLLLHPWRWFTGYNPFEFFWRNQQGRYHAHCSITSNGPDSIDVADCQIVAVQAYPPLISTTEL